MITYHRQSHSLEWTSVRRTGSYITALLGLALCLTSLGCGKQVSAQPRSAPRNTLCLMLLDETDSFVRTGYWERSVRVAGNAVTLLRPGDAVCVIGIDHHGFDRDDVRVPVTVLPKGALAAAQVKKVLLRQLSTLQPRPTSSGARGPDGQPRGTPPGTDTPAALDHAAHFASRARGSRVSLLVFSDFRNEPLKGRSGALSRPASFPPDTSFAALFVAEGGDGEAGGGREWEERVNRWVQTLCSLGVECAAADFYLGSESEDAQILKQVLTGRLPRSS